MKIFLAEDDPVTRTTIQELLEDEGYEVATAMDGTEAIHTWDHHRPEIILLDIMMPGASGYDVCRSIRKANRSIPILFLSAKSEEVDVVLGLELGADDFVRKPFGKHELLARIRAVTRRNESIPTGGSFPFGDWVIYPKRLIAENHGNGAIDLTDREIKILQLLIARQSEVVTRDELLNTCWGMEYYPESRTLDQHILNLRKKLEHHPSTPRWIQTVRGVGYRYP
ncbi:response regulator transcription factor [Luteolibacter pohnpeiensis]|uniref:Response regulator transcription factor n=1 Tax=Luteolibacter pohnpeiensis TaxID=454153 RepID=A0A934VVV9_9BACT|nr:response regulator transcription factor [Luteolibacter pohnpeiensis]MBK1882173.1 response regulator transcription factor [Luteolibacter pohnpeiensis]